jgi:hypothetical protein
MPRTCTVCAHPQRAEVEAAVLEGRDSFRGIARRFAVSPDAIERHAKAHLPAALVKGAEAQEVARGDGLLAAVERLQGRAGLLLTAAERVVNRAERSRNGELVLKGVSGAAAAVRELRSLLGLLAETGLRFQESEVAARARLEAEVKGAVATAEMALDPASFARLCRAWAALPGAGPERLGDDCNG